MQHDLFAMSMLPPLRRDHRAVLVPRAGIGLLMSVLASGPGLACKGRGTETESKASASAEGALSARENPLAATERGYPEEQTVSEHMGEHAEKATEMRDAVALASLGQIVQPAQWMAEHLSDTRVPREWRPYLEEFRLAAQEAAATKDYGVAANAIGRMGVACAKCHEKLGGPSPSLEPPPSEKDRMQRHLYAVDLLWDGLIMPSEKSWKDGAQALRVAPMTKEEIDETAHESTPKDAKTVADTIRALAAKAESATTDMRGKVYGEILKACSDCHRLTGQEG